MKLIQIDNFFDNLDIMLPEIKKVKLYTAKDHPGGKMTYPGTRSRKTKIKIGFTQIKIMILQL